LFEDHAVKNNAELATRVAKLETRLAELEAATQKKPSR
jgi:BMFP domain-containing protein YqiC